QRDTGRLAGGKCQGSPTFEHLIVGWAKVGQLEEVIHHPQARESSVLGPPGDLPKGRAKVLARSGPGKDGDLQSYTHSVPPSDPVTCCLLMPELATFVHPFWR